MKQKIMFIVLLIGGFCQSAPAAAIDGLWRTETNNAGGYLEVSIGACETDGTRYCGKITAAYSNGTLNPDYENLGKMMIIDMQSSDGITFSGGTIWDPQRDKVFKAKMSLSGNDLNVEGCVSLVCRGQHWVRVQEK